jgi:hypothetical protein
MDFIKMSKSKTNNGIVVKHWFWQKLVNDI